MSTYLRCAGFSTSSSRQLAAQIATDVLIIEDEALIALDLEALLENLGHRVVGVARTRSEAAAIARNKRPGLILADIQLADGSSGLDAVNDLLNMFEVPVIFITAYPERFLTGERPEPAFLVSKPYQPATVSALVSQALFFERNAVQRKRRASWAVVFIPHGPAPKGATGDNCPLRLHLPTAREGEGNGGRPVK